MAFLNLQTQTPKLNITNIKSPIGKLGNSIAKIPFGGVAKPLGFSPELIKSVELEPPASPSALYGIVEALQADVQALRQEQIETSEILNDIGNALATDFANRISEEKAQNTLLNKQRAKLRQRTKEENLEKGQAGRILGTKSSGIGLPKVGGGIFGKLMSFFTTIGSGIALTNIFKWLSDDGNRNKIKDIFKAVTDHWKWIVGAVGALVVADLALKLAGIASVLGVLGPVLTSPLFWIGAGIVMAAAHQGVGPAEKEVIKDLQLMGGSNEENRNALIAEKEALIAAEMAKPWLMRRPGLIQNLEKDINFIQSGDFGHGFGKKNINWDVLNETNKVVTTDKRHAGGSITKGRLYKVQYGETIIKAPFTGRVSTSKQLISDSRGGTTTVINMPPEIIEGEPPQLPEPTHTATDVDLVSSVNPLNPYMIEIPEMFCISV